MKNTLLFLAVLLPLFAFGQGGPIIRGPGTTNSPAAWTNAVRNVALELGAITNNDSRALTLNGEITLLNYSGPVDGRVANFDQNGVLQVSSVEIGDLIQEGQVRDGGALTNITAANIVGAFEALSMIATNGFFVPTNLPNAQIADFFRPIVTTNASANITFTGVANLQPGMENQAIWKIVPDGTYTVSFPSTWKNTAGAGSSYITTNGTHLHILVTAQMGVSTNVARLDYY